MHSTKALLLLCLISLPALAAERLVRLAVYSGHRETNIVLKAQEQLTVNNVLRSDDMAAGDVVLFVRYPEHNDLVRIPGGGIVSGPSTVYFQSTVNSVRGIAVAECRWVYNQISVNAPSQAVRIQRSEDGSTWSTLRIFRDTSTNAFYRWKIDPPEAE